MAERDAQQSAGLDTNGKSNPEIIKPERHHPLKDQRQTTRYIYE
jgi:hypothetical protein